MADIIGNEHGITQEQLKDLSQQTAPLIQQLNEERQEGKTPYRDLPYKSDISQKVKALLKELAPRCEILVVLGIGGSALGNIAVQTALNPYMYNLDDKQRTGPRLFVIDNVDLPAAGVAVTAARGHRRRRLAGYRPDIGDIPGNEGGPAQPD